ncbi:MAG: sulfide/dihydroorotate dehydrogenase-like FAD/NAD-binding protein [Burkholderiales bacterium]|nr:sulfide/dihydroorotate dehydrogenase-like FAD/NAD-binding protein [Burkholderiales bacterium]
MTAGDGGGAGGKFEIVAREDYSDLTYMLEVRHPMMARAARPGQFVIVMSHEHGERIPLTLADFDAQKGTITLVIQAVGKTTREMQRHCQVGTRLLSLVGPMGIPSAVSKAKRVVCVGGGLGVAPVFPQARAFKQAGAYVIGVLGFRDKKLVFWEDKFRKVCDDLILCTDDGSAGMKGMVTKGIEVAMKGYRDVDEVVAIGPPVMMRACAELTRPHRIKTMVSVNPIMVDGTGMCGGCRVKVGEQIRFACVDGPDFDGHLVDFEDLMGRLRRYAADENKAMQRWTESCRMGGPGEPGARDWKALAATPPESAIDELVLPDPFDDAQGG